MAGRIAQAWQRLRAALRTDSAWLLAHPASLAAVAVAGLGGAAVGVPAGDDAFTYMWKDDRFCNDCHVHDYANEAFERSVHQGMTTCHDCHRVPLRHYPRNLYVTVFDRPDGPEDIHAPDVDRVICAQCHSLDAGDEPLTGPLPEDVRAQVVKIDDSPLHAVHLAATSRDPADWQGGAGETGEAEDAHGDDAGGAHGDAHGDSAEEITCMDCHGAESNRAHRFGATRDNCVSCHVAMEPGQPGHDQDNPVSCRTCHFEGFVGSSPTNETGAE